MTKPLLDLSYVLDTLCPDWTPAKLTALWRNVLIQYFSNPAFIDNTCFANRPWKPTDDTGILIEDIGNWKPETTGLRPAILIKRQDQQGLQVGIGNRMMGGNPVGEEMYSFLWRGAHTFFCIAREYGEAESLALLTARQVFRFQPIIIRHLGNIQRVSPPSIAAVSVVEEAAQHFVVPVSLAYAYWESWEITTEGSSPAKKFNISIEPT